MICFGCHEDVDYYDTVYDDGEFIVCKHCPQSAIDKLEKLNAHYQKLGCTRSDICGCSRCAFKFETERT